MKQATTKQSGQSFQTVKMYHLENSPIVSRNDYPVIAGKKCTSAAQAMTVIGYGDSFNLAVRSLDYQIKCEDFKDFATCIKLINSYNEFDSDRILAAAKGVLDLKMYLNENNGNNGGSLFTFIIARESSPAFYVKYNEKHYNKVVTNIEAVQATETTPQGNNIFWEEYTADEFKEQMSRLSGAIGADEFSIEWDFEYSDGQKCYSARFWFD